MVLNFQVVMLQAGTSASPGGTMMPVFMIVGMFIVMYFFMIRPQQKRAKEQKTFSDSIATGEQIVTSAGIHGRINKTNDDGTMQIEISRGTFMTIDRSAVSMEMTTAFRKKTDAAAGTTVATTK